MNSVHPHQDDRPFKQRSHYIFSFHDSTFEAVARSFPTREVDGPLRRVAQEMAATLDWP